MEGSLIHWRNSHEWVNKEDLSSRYRHRWATATLECSARALMAEEPALLRGPEVLRQDSGRRVI